MAHTSLYEVLTQFSDTPAATEIIRTVQEFLSLIATSANVRGNSHSLLSSLSFSQDLGEKITKLIKQTESDGVSDWTNFDNYTKLIAPLEEFLLKLAAYQESDTLDTFKGTSIVNYLDAGDTWLLNRILVSETGPKLLSADAILSKEETVGSYQIQLVADRAHDDLSLANSLLAKSTDLCNSAPAGLDSSKRWNVLKTIGTFVSALLSGINAATDDVKPYRIRFGLAFVGVVDLLKASETPETEKARLASPSVINALGTFVTALNAGAPGTDQTWETRWETLRSALLQGLHILAPGLGELRKLTASIRAPYYLQCLLLVKACRDLCVAFNESTTSAPVVQPLKDAVNNTEAALRAAAEIRAATLKTLDFSLLKLDTVDTLYTTAVGSVRTCFTEFTTAQVEGTPTFDEDAWSEAKRRDEAIYAGWKAKLENANRSASSNLIEVTVRNGSESTTYKVDGDSSLNAILWSEYTRAKPDKKDKIRSGQFKKGDTQWPHETKISTLAGEESAFTVNLTVG